MTSRHEAELSLRRYPRVKLVGLETVREAARRNGDSRPQGTNKHGETAVTAESSSIEI